MWDWSMTPALTTCSRSWCTTPSAVPLVRATRPRSPSYCNGVTKSSSGSCPRCSCVCLWTSECSCWRSSSRSLHSKIHPTTSTTECTVEAVTVSADCDPCVCVCVCAYSCKAQRNLNSAFAIIMGLNTAAVSRLNQTWEVSVRLSCLCLSNSYFITNTFGQCFPLRNVRGSSRSFSQNWSSSRWDSNAEQWKSALTADDWCLSLTGGVFLNGRTRLWTTKPTEKPSRGWNLQRSPSCLFFWKVRSTTLTVADAPSFFLPTMMANPIFLCRYHLYPRGKQDLPWQPGQLWKAGELSSCRSKARATYFTVLTLMFSKSKGLCLCKNTFVKW